MNGLLLKFKEKQKNLFRASSSWRLETEPKMVHPSVPGGMLLSGSFRGWIVVGLILMFAWNLSWNIRVFEPANAEGPAGGATIPGEGAIQAVTDPPGAGLLMDGHFVGVTPIRFDWDPGTHRLELKKFGFHDLVVDIQVARGRRMEVDLKLYPVQPTRPQGMGSVASTSVTGSTPAGVSKEYPPVVVDPLPAVGAAAKPSAWVVKPGQGEVKASEPAVKGPEGKGSGRVYTVEDADSQKITGRVQEMARSEMPFRYTIQVGAFLDRESALKLAAHWRRKGYDAYLLELYGIKDPSRLWQSVRIGRFDNIMEARRFLDDFHAKEKSDGYLALSDSFAPPTQALLTSGQGAGKGAGRGVPPVAANKDPVGLTSPSPAVGPGAQPKQGGAELPVIPAVPGTVDSASRDLAGGAPGTPTIEVVAPVPQAAGGAHPPIEPAGSAGHDPMQGGVGSKEAGKGLDLGPVVLAAEDGRPGKGGRDGGEPASAVTPPVIDLNVDLSQVGTPSVPQFGTGTGKKEGSTGEQGAVGANKEAQVLYDQAMTLEKEGKVGEAQAAYQRVLDRDPGHLSARQRLARIHVESGRADEALAVLKPAVAGRDSRSLARADPNFSAFLAALYQRQEEHWKAVDLYEALLQQDPNRGIWQMGMAISLEKLNEPANALHYYEKALESGALSSRLRTFVQKRVRNLK